MEQSKPKRESERPGRVSRDPARDAYETLASFYDEFTSAQGYLYERWTRQLLAKAEAAGLRGRRLLDVACGTGLSFLPMLDRGFEVTGCDISPAMVEVARAKVGDRARLLVADMRELPDLGEFDLIWTVNDAINYLGGVEEMEATLEGMRRNLAPEGIVLLDLASLASVRSFVGEEGVVEKGERKFTWRGLEPVEEVAPGTIGEARFEAVGEAGTAHVHRFRHFPEDEVRAAIEASGLRCVEVFNELGTALDEESHTQVVYLCRLS
ncbi:MAG: methyltransferase domain-containing protein [Actinomycetota bacterium]|nr:methyltransferase domain-containing protein [Actinomycetota bacterium]